MTAASLGQMRRRLRRGPSSREAFFLTPRTKTADHSHRFSPPPIAACPPHICLRPPQLDAAGRRRLAAGKHWRPSVHGVRAPQSICNGGVGAFGVGWLFMPVAHGGNCSIYSPFCFGADAAGLGRDHSPHSSRSSTQLPLHRPQMAGRTCGAVVWQRRA